MESSQLSPRGATLMGLVLVAMGVFPILIGLGVLTPDDAATDTPTWVPVAAGLLFVVAGVTIILDFGIAEGVGPDNELVAGTPLAIQTANLILGSTIVGLMAAVMGWIAFGSGQRLFGTASWIAQAGEMAVRFVFGAATVLLIVMFVGSGARGVRRLWRLRQKPDQNR